MFPRPAPPKEFVKPLDQTLQEVHILEGSGTTLRACLETAEGEFLSFVSWRGPPRSHTRKTRRAPNAIEMYVCDMTYERPARKWRLAVYAPLPGIKVEASWPKCEQLKSSTGEGS